MPTSGSTDQPNSKRSDTKRKFDRESPKIHPGNKFSHTISVMSPLAFYCLQFPFAEVTLHYTEFSGNENISHQSRTCFLTYFWWSSETMRFLWVSFSFVRTLLRDYPSSSIILQTPGRLLHFVKCTVLKGFSMQSYRNWMPNFWAKNPSLRHCGLCFPH